MAITGNSGVGLFSGNHGENFASVAQVIRVGLKRSLWEAWGVSNGFGESDFAMSLIWPQLDYLMSLNS